MKTLKNLIAFFCCYLLTGLLISFSQSKDLSTQENKFEKQFSTLSNGTGDSEKFEKDFSASFLQIQIQLTFLLTS
jgi:hypothetical protein